MHCARCNRPMNKPHLRLITKEEHETFFRTDAAKWSCEMPNGTHGFGATPSDAYRRAHGEWPVCMTATEVLFRQRRGKQPDAA